MSIQADDLKLMQRVAAGDEAGIDQLYSRFAPLVFKASRQVLSSNAEAEDAVQEIYLRLWQTADRYDPRRAKLITWVMLLTRRHLIDRLRRKSSRPDPGHLEESAAPAGPPSQSHGRLQQAESLDRAERR